MRACVYLSAYMSLYNCTKVDITLVCDLLGQVKCQQLFLWGCQKIQIISLSFLYQQVHTFHPISLLHYACQRDIFQMLHFRLLLSTTILKAFKYLPLCFCYYLLSHVCICLYTCQKVCWSALVHCVSRWYLHLAGCKKIQTLFDSTHENCLLMPCKTIHNISVISV